MKTAVMITPNNITEDYLLACTNKVHSKGYVLIHSTTWHHYRQIDFIEFIGRADSLIDAFFLFVDYGTTELMIDLVKKYYISGVFLKEIRIDAIGDVKPDSLCGILMQVSKFSGLSIEQLKSKIRQRPIAEARQIYFKRARERTKHSLAEIGAFVCKDHATVMHGIKTVDNIIYLTNRYNEYFHPHLRKPVKKAIAETKPAIKIDSVKAEIMAMMPHAPESERKVIRGDVHQTYIKGYEPHFMKA